MRGSRYKSSKSHSGEVSEAAKLAARKRLFQQQGERIDARFGYERLEDSLDETAGNSKIERRGWLFNFLPTTRIDPSNGAERSGLDLYFLGDDGNNFRTTLLHRPFFYLLAKGEEADPSIGPLLERNFGNQLASVELIYKLDLDQPNHLSPDSGGRPVWKLSFDNVSLLMEVRRELMSLIRKNSSKCASETDGAIMQVFDDTSTPSDPLSSLGELREHDVPYASRVCMDMNIRAGSWFTVTVESHEGEMPQPVLSEPDIETKANPTFLAFDIECTKAPLKFPSADVDEIYMISYMVSDGGNDIPRGYLICSRTVVSEDVHDFEYTPKPAYKGPFQIFNEENEEQLIRCFVKEYQLHRPQIVSTYNGDSFDWPFLQARASKYGISLWEELGVCTIGDSGEYRGRCSVHLDAYRWVQRDSYLPQGAQGLKAVTKYKLGYDPVEIDPEDMLPMAQKRPLIMATYSVSDAVATFYLYEKYIHLFIFSLCTLIPMGPEDVLRKGSGTLCEALLMVEACELNIVCPNKQVDPQAKFHDGHLLESETYIGGKVECLETGVYRSDVEYDFDLKPAAFQSLIDTIDRDLCFAIEVEAGLDRSQVTNYETVRSKIVESLELLRDRPKRKEMPFIYHLDVGAMYPNIILTNRLQPSAMVDDATCAACDFNQAKNGCKREMDWIWRGDFTPAGKLEYNRIKSQMSSETAADGRPFKDLPEREQSELIASRLKQYARNAYGKVKITQEITKRNTVCMRENEMYVDTVRRFRDRRYDYKKMTKTWKKKVDSAKDPAEKKFAQDKALVFDSLQVAHKCILNSFYGYVMRKGARWRSMEMAGIVTKNGADIITQARTIVEQIGRPLELDTDGIWCILPKSFPDEYTFHTNGGSSIKIEYPCLMLNADCHDKFTNHQYQILTDKKRGHYETRSECSIFFEVDGPYRCMVIPASTEEGKLLKKRYAVFNFDGSLAELKGFELKRRGELELIKTFQSQVFQRFLDGESLLECYQSVAEVANHWIDVIDTQGQALNDDELVELISENRSMSRQLEDYGDQKGTSQTTARRLGQFLGSEIIKDKGLNCKFIIADQPRGAPVTERAIPTAIWKAEPSVTKKFLREWLEAPGLDGAGLDIRNVLDWGYYLNRLGKTIQKIITIPAALQKVPNPVPRIDHPEWLQGKVLEMNNRFQQRSIRSMFLPGPAKSKASIPLDIEDVAKSNTGNSIIKKSPLVRRMAHTPLHSNRLETSDKTTLTHVRLTRTTFDSWLKHKKSAWKKSRLQKKSTESNSLALRGKKRSTIEGFVKEAAYNLATSEWHVLEVREMTSFDRSNTNARNSSSGEFIAWIMLGDQSLQRIQISVPRVVYVTSSEEIVSTSSDITACRKVSKNLPHEMESAFTYEVTLPEFVFKHRNWISGLKPKNPQAPRDSGSFLKRVFEASTPLMARALTEIGCISRLSPNSAPTSGQGQKFFPLSSIQRVDGLPVQSYLGDQLPYKRIYLYIKINPRNKTGIIALFSMSQAGPERNGNHSTKGTARNDAAPFSQEGAQQMDFSLDCNIWVLKPNAKKGQNGLGQKHCQDIFSHLLEELLSRGEGSDFLSVSPESRCVVKTLDFIHNEAKAFKLASEALNSLSKRGPTVVVLNSTKPFDLLRRQVTALNSYPVIPIPFPPGPHHSQFMSTLPSLNWEQPAMQLCFEAYLYMCVVSFPKRLSSARYGNIPLGNLGNDEHFTLYDVMMARLLQKHHMISWASPSARPDLGTDLLESNLNSHSPVLSSSDFYMERNEIWGDVDELISPVIRRPGCYRSLCVDVSIQDLVVCTLSAGAADLNTLGNAGIRANFESLSQAAPNGGKNQGATVKNSEPLGDETSTSASLHILRLLVGTWLRDAFNTNNDVADRMLHDLYRIVTNKETLMHDPALHRVVHSQMKATFMHLLSELQRLGCTVVHGTFSKLTIATNKATLSDAEEYINFVISTICSHNESNEIGTSSPLARITLRPKLFHSHFLFLDEYNFGTLHLERRPRDEDHSPFIIDEADETDMVIVPSVVTAWNMMNYLGSDLAQEYFRIIIARFSREVFVKQMALKARETETCSFSVFSKQLKVKLAGYTAKLVSHQFASYLTRAVGEIVKDCLDNRATPSVARTAFKPIDPALQFIKSVIVVLELDKEVEAATLALKRGLLSQVGVAEYANIAKWENPCQTFVLPDVFCAECYDCHDVNLCYIDPSDHDDDGQAESDWYCSECGTQYNKFDIEQRLIVHIQKQLMRYQLQDLRCSKTRLVATEALANISNCAAGLRLDISSQSALSETRILDHLAEQHQLDELRATTQGILVNFFC